LSDNPGIVSFIKENSLFYEMKSSCVATLIKEIIPKHIGGGGFLNAIYLYNNIRQVVAGGYETR
jgi:hypothetical protein